MSDPILQPCLMDPPWRLPGGTRLPGISPIAPDDWLRVDDAYAGQMALRDALLRDHTEAVYRIVPEAEEAAQELLAMVLEWVGQQAGYQVTPDHVTRPDGVQVPLDRNNPLLTAGRLVQEDLCLHLQQGDEHVLCGAVLCFPASWSLDEKIGKPLTRIHKPVPQYQGTLATRVQRLFDAIRVGQPLVRANCLTYVDPSLHQPRRENARRVQPGLAADYVRTERQCLLRLAQTRAVVFSIHTTVVERATLSPEDDAAMVAYLAHHKAGALP